MKHQRIYSVVSVALVGVLLPASSGCMVGKGPRKAIYVMDAALMVGGAGVAIAGATSDCMPEPSGDPIADVLVGPAQIGACSTGKAAAITLGIALVTAGLTGMAITAASDPGRSEQPDPGVQATQAALERGNCDGVVQAYRAERFPRARAQLLRDMPPKCRVRARATSARL